MQRVFISYSRRNKPFAERLARDLSDAGLDIWIDFRQIHAGEKWKEEILRGIERSEIVVAALSPDAVSSEWVQWELLTARAKEKFIIPIMAENALPALEASTELNWLLDVQYTDFANRYEEAFTELLQSLPGRRRISPYDTVDPESIPNPFKGLEAFQQTDAIFFFGRETLIQKSLQRLKQERSTRFLAVVGASGSGKSSLVRAGVIPALRRGALPYSEHWRVMIFTPGEDPVDALSRRLAPFLPDREAGQINALLHQSAEYLDPLVEQALQGTHKLSRLLMVIDQFEETFTRAGEEERTLFLQILNDAVTRRGGRAHVLITMRADFFDRLSQYPALAELFEQENMVIVTEMSPAELFRSIEGPAHAVGLSYDEGLPQRILADVQSQPGSLPLLQYALKELYERREGNRLTMSAYREIGGVQRALARHAEEIYTSMNAAQQAIMRRILLRLIEVSETGEPTRRRVNRDELHFRDVPDEAVQEVLDLLTSAESRLLIASREIKSLDDQGAPLIRVEIGHEALIREWERFREWVAGNLENLRYGSELMKSARDWVQRNRDKSYLLTGNRLARAETWLQESDATALQREFIQASMEEHERQEDVRRQQIQRELTLQRRAATRLRLVAVVLVVGLVITVILGLLAVEQSNRANDALTQAELNEKRARSLALSSSAVRAFSDGDNEQAVMLAVEANVVDVLDIPPQAPRTLSEIAYQPGTRYVFSAHEGTVSKAIFSPDGDTALSASENVLILWDTTTTPNNDNSAGDPAEIRRFAGHEKEITALDFRPVTDGTQALTGDRDGQLMLWDLTTGELIDRFSVHADSIAALDFNPAGTQFVSVDTDGVLILWDVASANGQLVYQFPQATTIMALAFGVGTADQVRAVSDDGIMYEFGNYNVQNTYQVNQPGTTTLSAYFSDDLPGQVLIGYGDGRAIRWEIETGAVPLAQAEYTLSSGRGVTALALSPVTPDGQWLALGSATGEVSVFNLETQAHLLTLDGHDARVNSVAFNTLGGYLLSASNDASVRLWDLDDGAKAQTYAGHPDSNPVMALYREVGGVTTVLSAAADSDNDGDGVSDFSLRLWDSTTGAEIRRYEGHTARITDIAINAANTQVMAASRSGEVIVWDAETGAIISRWLAHTSGTEAMAFIPGATQRVITGATLTGEMAVWDLSDPANVVIQLLIPGGIQKNAPGHLAGIADIAVSSDGLTALSGGQDNAIILWNLSTLGTPEAAFTQRLSDAAGNGHNGAVLSVRFATGNLRAASGSGDSNIILWNLTPGTVGFGQPIREFDGHDAGVYAVDFAPDGRSIISASEDRTVRLWDIATGFELRRFNTAQDAEETPRSVDFRADGLQVVTGMNDSTLIEWRVLIGATNLLDWTIKNRFVPVATCDERQLFDLEPLCASNSDIPPTRTPFPVSGFAMLPR